MKFKAVLFLILLFSSGSVLYTNSKALVFGGVHDSLLFDGSSEVKTFENVFDDDCDIKVTKVSGFVVGAKTVRDIYQICGEWDTINRVETAAQLKEGDKIMKRQEIKTGDDGFIRMELKDGSVIAAGPNSSIFIDEIMCETARTLVKVKTGSIWTKIKKLLGGGKFEVSTENGGGGVRGTEFTYEVSGDKDIVKVYEGSFEVFPPKNMSSIENMYKEMEKLQKEFEAGKITMEEYSKRMAELADATKQHADEFNPVMVEAGFMFTMSKSGSGGKPEPIPADDNKWFEDPRIK
ncbi:MAG TPA: FecR domain-containing protein [Ignavibacteria bacterium]|nr:FecR domain-containing protein [Ignavibacteria bacterium]